MDPSLIAERITARTKAIVVVHLYGHPVDMDPVLSIARQHGLIVVEDAAEAHGAEYRGKKVGSIGDVGTFSFYGNKILTTGEGGIVTTNDSALASIIRQLKAQGIDPQRRYWFPVIGYNYRMTNVAAAVGLAQLEKVDWHLGRRLEVARWYRDRLSGRPELTWQAEQEWAKHAYWMFTILLDDGVPVERDQVISMLLERGIETRPIFYPVHILPPYEQLSATSFPIAERIARRGISLPSWGGLTRDDVDHVCSTLLSTLRP
jgi:perosamine synthetase